MVEDSNIKTKISPFAVKPGEIKVFDGKDGFVTMDNILKRINEGHITDIHFKIIEIVNEFEFITSRQLFQILQYRKADIPSQDKLNAKLEQLIKLKILTRYFFQSEDGKGIYRVYALEKMGKYLLNSREIECKWQATDNTKPVHMIKKRLAGNQVIVAYLNKVKAFDSYVVKPTLNAKQSKKMFKPQAGIKLSKGDKSIDLIYDVVRREDGWEERFLERMKLFEDFYHNFVTLDSGYKQRPQLVFDCEDDKHMVEVFKILVTNQIVLDGIHYLFTTDLKQNEETLSKTLVQFKLDEETNKYKIETVELKILE
ncbi:MAG: replication-relaxation family protein [Clostridia bacterium]